MSTNISPRDSSFDSSADAASQSAPSAGTIISIAGRQLLVGLKFLLAMTVILGIAYPLLVLGIGRLIAPAKAGGSLVSVNGAVVGSSLIGQDFTGDKWFASRPSAAGNGYDATASGGSNLSADSPVLLKSIQQLKTAIAQSDGVPESAVPPDAVTSSGSGLDPEISAAYALIQVNRVAAARGLSASAVHALVQAHIQSRMLGFIGQQGVNVLQLNIAVMALPHG